MDHIAAMIELSPNGSMNVDEIFERYQRSGTTKETIRLIMSLNSSANGRFSKLPTEVLRFKLNTVKYVDYITAAITLSTSKCLTLQEIWLKDQNIRKKSLGEVLSRNKGKRFLKIVVPKQRARWSINPDYLEQLPHQPIKVNIV